LTSDYHCCTVFNTVIAYGNGKHPPRTAKATLDLTESSLITFVRGSQLLKAASAFFPYAASAARHTVAGLLAITIMYLSLLATSAPMAAGEMDSIERAVQMLEDKGFGREVFLLRHFATFRDRDNWINTAFPAERAFAATNFPFGLITLYPDFYDKADDTTRAMILLHEAQHLTGAGEADAYRYVWQNRQRLGWTQLRYGPTDAYVTIELETRELSPELFNCTAMLWNDCTNELARK
jgi:hypothetical protein